MALVKPFRALRYDVGTAGPLDDLVSPPHDVITPELHARLLAASPYNAVRLVRPDAPEEAALALAQWQQRGVLVREDRPAVWLLEEEFAAPGGARLRRGVVARVALHPYEDGVVLPHERTFPREKEARLDLLRATRTKLSPVFLLHEGDAPPRPPGAPRLEAELDGTRSRLWPIAEPGEVNGVLAGLRGPFVVADGHHRYETAFRFHEQEGSEETSHVLAVLVGRDDPGLEILPTHRVTTGPVPDLNGGLRLRQLSRPEEALAALGGLPRDRAAFVLVEPGGATLAEADDPGPDTAVVDRLALEDVSFTASAADAARAVSAGEATAAFLVRPPSVHEVEAVARAGGRMPPKSTYFYPKLASGFLFAPFDE